MIKLSSVRQDNFAGIYSISLFLYLLHSMHPWFLLWLPTVWASIYFLVISLIAQRKSYFKFQLRPVCAFCFFILFLWLKRDANIYGVIEAFINSYIFASVLSLKKDILLYNLECITKWMAILLFVSSVAFILYICGIPLPNTTLSATGAFDSLQTNNYYFFINAASFTDLGRFRSVFYEPGYLTLGVASLLYLHKYNYRNRYVLILLFAQILSFSLAGFVLLAWGWVYISICQGNRDGVKKFEFGGEFIAFVLLLMGEMFGDTYIQDTLFSRLEWVDGTIAGDNRSSNYLDSVYKNMMNSSNMWTGVDFNIEMSESGVSGYKLFAVQNGLIGVILVVMSFISLISLKKIRFNLMTGAVILFLLLLYQNAYPSSMCILFPAACIKYVFDINVPYKM